MNYVFGLPNEWSAGAITQAQLAQYFQMSPPTIVVSSISVVPVVDQQWRVGGLHVVHSLAFILTNAVSPDGSVCPAIPIQVKPVDMQRKPKSLAGPALLTGDSGMASGSFVHPTTGVTTVISVDLKLQTTPNTYMGVN